MYMVIQIKKLDQYLEEKRPIAGEKEHCKSNYVHF